jgi:serine/threonine-protein kinase RsbW
MVVDRAARTRQDEATVAVTVPADTRYVRVVRLAAQGVAALLDLDIEEHEDLRVGINEVCAALLEAGDGSPLELRLWVDDGELVLQGTTPAGAERLDDLRWELSDRMLAELVDAHRVDVRGGRVEVEIRKRRGQR